MSAQRLINVLAVGPLNPGASQTIAHGITREGAGRKPRMVIPDRVTGIGVTTITTTAITFTNNGTSPADSANFYVQLEHTFERLATDTTAFSWQGGGTGSGSLITPGTNRGALINAAIQAAVAGQTVTLAGPGIYYCEVPIVAKSGVTLDLNGGTLTASYAPVVGLADDPTNCFVDVRGAADTALLNTTLALVRQVGDTTVTTVAAPTTGSLNSKWIKVTGHPAANGSNSTGDSDGASVSLFEPIKVTSNVLGTLTTPPLQQHHDQTNTVQGWVPIEDFALVGGTLDCSGGSIAVGVNGQGSSGLVIDNLKVKGFSRAAIELQGALDWSVTNITDLGECNSLLFMNSALSGEFYNFRADNRTALRTHANGVPRFKIWTKNRSSSIAWDALELVNGSGGMEIWGGHDWTGGHLSVFDVNPDAMYTARVANGEYNSGQAVGATWHGGAAPVTFAEFAWNMSWDSVEGQAFASSVNDDTRYTAYIHDAYYQTVGGLTTRNSGGLTVFDGVKISDSGGHIDNVQVDGYDYGLGTENANCYFTIDEFRYYGQDAAGNITLPSMNITHLLGAMQIRHADVTQDPRVSTLCEDWEFEIGTLYNGAAFFGERVQIGYNAAGASVTYGDLVERHPANLSSAYQRIFQKPAAGATRFMVAVVPSNNGDRTFVSVLMPGMRARIRCGTGEVNPGDRVRWSGSAGDTLGVVNNGAASFLVQALTYKAAGSAGVVEGGPGALDLSPLALTSASGSIAVDLSRRKNFTHTLTENTTLAAPSNLVAGETYSVVFTQAASAKTLAFNAAWDFLAAGAPTISTTNGKRLMVSAYSPDGTTMIAVAIADS